jgi:hypothetical protein
MSSWLLTLSIIIVGSWTVADFNRSILYIYHYNCTIINPGHHNLKLIFALRMMQIYFTFYLTWINITCRSVHASNSVINIPIEIMQRTQCKNALRNAG